MATDGSNANTRQVPLSVVVPARNAAATLGQQLAALAQQDHTGPIEVVVVDNDSNDDTSEVAASYRDRLPRLQVVEARRRRSVAHARNVGFAAASNELVLVCDADDVVDVHWAGRLAEALTTSDVAGGGVVDWTGGALAGRPPHSMVTGFGFLPSFAGCNFGSRRAVWAAIGGFDEELRSGEDFDFAWRAQLAGYRYSLQVSAFVYYRVDVEPRAAFRRWRHYGNYEPALYRKYRGHGLYRQPLHRAAARWLLLAATSYRLVTGPDATRMQWCREAGRRVGRAQGSVRSRTLFL